MYKEKTIYICCTELFQIELFLHLKMTDGPSLQRDSKCPGYDTKQSDGEASVMLELWGMRGILFIAIAPWSTLARSSST